MCFYQGWGGYGDNITIFFIFFFLILLSLTSLGCRCFNLKIDQKEYASPVSDFLPGSISFVHLPAVSLKSSQQQSSANSLLLVIYFIKNIYPEVAKYFVF